MEDARKQAAGRKESRRAKRKLRSKSEFRPGVYLRNLGLVLVSGAVVVEEEEDEEEVVAAS